MTHEMVMRFWHRAIGALAGFFGGEGEINF